MNCTSMCRCSQDIKKKINTCIVQAKLRKKKDVCVCVCVCIDLIDMIEGVTKSGSVTVHIAPRGRFFIMMFTSFEFSALVER